MPGTPLVGSPGLEPGLPGLQPGALPLELESETTGIRIYRLSKGMKNPGGAPGICTSTIMDHLSRQRPRSTIEVFSMVCFGYSSPVLNRPESGWSSDMPPLMR